MQNHTDKSFYCPILHLLWACLLALPLPVMAQSRVQYTWEQFVDDYLQYVADLNDASDNYVERYDWLEELEEIHRNPIDINACERDELLALHFLSDEQVDSLLAKRNRYRGGFASLGELMAVRQLGYRERAWLSLFCAFHPHSDTPERKSSQTDHPSSPTALGTSVPRRTNRWYGGTYDVIATLDAPLYRRAGFYDYNSDNYETKMFTGYNAAHTIRAHYNWRQRVMYGITVQEDVGERFGVYGGHPWDYQSAYFFYKSDPIYHSRHTPSPTGYGHTRSASAYSRLTLAAGDYRLSLGQGLIMSGGGWMQQTSLFGGMHLDATRIRPHTGTDESRFLRGAAATVRMGRHGQWALTAFGSYRQLDGTLQEHDADDGADKYISAWKTDGLHRTFQEIGKRHVATQLLAGGRAGYATSSLNVGLNAVWLHYDKPYLPASRTYNKYYMRGREASAISADYAFRRGIWALLGELAFDAHGHYASTATMRCRPLHNVLLVAQERSLSEKFVSPYGHTLMANSQIQNEHALLLGMQWKATAQLQLTAYGDAALHPNAVYLADTTSHRFSAMMQGLLRSGNHWTHTLTYRIKSRQQNVTGYRDIPDLKAVLLSWRTTQHARWQSVYARQHWSLTLGADGACYYSQGSSYDKKTATINGAGISLGALVYARVAATPTSHLRLSGMLAGFATDDYNTRCYAYVPQLRGSVGVPNFYGRGIMAAFTVDWRAWRELYVAARMSMVHYFDRDAISSGINLIDSSSKNDLALQLRYRF